MTNDEKSGLTMRVLNSKVDDNLTLEQFLYGVKGGHQGYLKQNEYLKTSVIFLEGKLDSTYIGKDLDKYKISKFHKNKQIPVIFSYDKSMDELVELV